MAIFNSKTITLKVDVCSMPRTTNCSLGFDKGATKLKADALEALLVSANPIRKDYALKNEDFAYIAEKRIEMENIISNMMGFLREKQAV